jgi:hypothetical protein
MVRIKSALVLLFFIFFSNCDTSKRIEDNLVENLLCYSFANCGNAHGSKFIMLGDSWTDLLFGVPAIQTLRTHLEMDYNYRIIGATIGGQELNRVLSSGLHIQSIDQAGAEAKYVLLSLGGNDLQARPQNYAADHESELNRRFQELETNLRNLILSGNAHKMNKYGGDPLLWIIHGYDYPNPDNTGGLSSTSCRPTLLAAGIQDADVQRFTSDSINRYNDFLFSLTYKYSDLRYIDLRRTLGGPPYSPANLMVDCIHPSSVGFKMLTDQYVSKMKVWTGDDK